MKAGRIEICQLLQDDCPLLAENVYRRSGGPLPRPHLWSPYIDTPLKKTSRPMNAMDNHKIKLKALPYVGVYWGVYTPIKVEV